MRYENKKKIRDPVAKSTINSNIYIVIARNGPGGINVDISNVEELMSMFSNPHDYDCISIRDERHRRHFCHTCNNRDACGLTIDTAFLCNRCIEILKTDIRKSIEENSDKIFPYVI